MRAKKIYEAFSGAPADMRATAEYAELRKNDELKFLGAVKSIDYSAYRDGELQSYRHAFASWAEPLAYVRMRDRQLFMIGNNYRFGDRGFIDTPAKARVDRGKPHKNGNAVIGELDALNLSGGGKVTGDYLLVVNPATSLVFFVKTT